MTLHRAIEQPNGRTTAVLLPVVLAMSVVTACHEGAPSGHASGGNQHSPAAPGTGAGEHPGTGAQPRTGADSTVPAVGPILRGSEAWRLRNRADGQIEGYADRVGGPPGTLVGLRVSTVEPSYRVLAYRIGAYRHGTGRLVWSSDHLPGERQAAPVMRQASTRTVTAPWHESLRVDTKGFVPGAYLFKLVARSGLQAAVPYVVTSPSVRGRVVVVAPVTTWQAYNEWGGYSLYHGPAGDRRAWRVTFDRPYRADGLGELGFGLAPVAIEAERAGVPLAYLTNVDLEADREALAGAEGYLSAGHDEYWTPGMRDAVEQARDAGTDLAFLGANTMYWRIRLEPSALGPRRTVVGYRSDAALDPEEDPRFVTGRFRDAPAPRSERAVVGMEYECFPVHADYRVVSPRWWGFAGTGVRRGTTFPRIVGDEADRVYPGSGTPRPLQVLSHSPYSCGGVPTSAQSTWYSARSGAGVFSVGTLGWTCALTGNCFGEQVSAPTRRFVARVTRTVVAGFAAGETGAAHPARDNVADFVLPRTNEVPAS